MNAYLLRHAIANVWCNPAQDNQYVYRLARLSPKYGVRGMITLLYERVELPTSNDRYHVYQLGKVAPSWLGVPDQPRKWMALSDLIQNNQVYTEVYLDNGISFPRFDCHVRLTTGRNLLVAVRINERVHPLEEQLVYLRFYSNAFFNSMRSEGKRYIHYRGRRLTSNNDVLAFQSEANNLIATHGGYPYYYVNGRFTHNVSPVSAGVDDYVEFVLDGSIKRVVEFPIAELPSFHSSLDAANKYILHYDDPSVNTILYRDDVDLFLVRRTSSNVFRGVTYHRNTDDWLRMLTHKDYSLPARRVESLVAVHPLDPRHELDPTRWDDDKWTHASELSIRLYIRNSGYERPLGPDANRIQELYRLPDEDIVRAMTGDDAVLDIWRAENLERCPYVQFMSLDPSIIYPLTFNIPNLSHPDKTEANEFAGRVYGFHAAASILASTPRPVDDVGGVRRVELAYEHRVNSTVYEYDTNGHLLGHHLHVNGHLYKVRSPECVQVEAITGTGGNSTNSILGNTPVDIPYGHNYRLYITNRYAGEPTGNWIDISEADDLHEYGYLDDTQKQHRWVWTYNPLYYHGMIRIDDKFLAVDLDLRKQSGHLRFNVGGMELDDGDLEYRLTEVPPGQFDVFLNGRMLIEDLDYVVRWPEVVINNLEYLREGDIQRIHYRAYGFCDSQLRREPPSEVGFVRHGVLSRNNRYDLHSHKVRRVVIDGRYFDPATLQYDEDNELTTIEAVRNGAPYVIQTPPVVFRDLYGLDFEARRVDDDIDRKVGNYMSDRYPVIDRGSVDHISTQYHVMSVFANKLLHDLREGYLYPDGIEGHYSDQDVYRWCEPYAWLLEYDLCNRDYDEEHVEIWPHWFGEPVGLDLYKYQFFVRALRLHLQRVPDLAPFLKIVSLEA